MKIINIDKIKATCIDQALYINCDVFPFRSDSELSDSSSNNSLPSLEEFSTCANDEHCRVSAPVVTCLDKVKMAAPLVS